MEAFGEAIAGSDLALWALVVAAPLLALPLGLLARPRLFAPANAACAGWIDLASAAALRIAFAGGALTLTAQLAAVVVRYAFGLSFSWLGELVVLGYASTFLLAAPSALKTGAHVRVDILRPSFSPAGRAAIEMAGTYVFILPITLVILWSIEPSLLSAIARGEGSRESDGLPLYVVFLRTLLPVFAVLLLAQGAAQAMKAALVVRGLRPEDDAAAPVGAA